MGACNSCEATAVAAAVTIGGAAVGEAAARVVLAGGELQRFPGGTRAAHAVKATSAAVGGSAGTCFLCIADGLELGGAVPAVAPEEELQPGQLYFVLPVAMRRRPLQAEDMAALAVRASAALAGDHDGPLVFPDSAATTGGGASAMSCRRKGCRRSARRTASSRSRARDFVPDLGAIAE